MLSIEFSKANRKKNSIDLIHHKYIFGRDRNRRYRLASKNGPNRKSKSFCRSGEEKKKVHRTKKECAIRRSRSRRDGEIGKDRGGREWRRQSGKIRLLSEGLKQART